MLMIMVYKNMIDEHFIENMTLKTLENHQKNHI